MLAPGGIPGRELSGKGRTFAIATPVVRASETGLKIAQDGGSAIDAAIAANAILTVAYPHMCAIGGDLLALVGKPDGEVLAINGSGAAARRIDVDGIRAAAAVMPLTGPLTISVPGTLSAWAALDAIGGRLGLSRTLEPAIEAARDGASVTPSLARALEAHATELRADHGFAKIYFVDGQPLPEGSSFCQPALADTLETIAGEGVESFYGGQLGLQFVKGLQAAGSPLRLDDLASHQTEQTAPLSARYRDFEILTTPPNSQGVLLLEMLGVLEPMIEALDPMGPDAALIAEVFRIVSLDRDRYLADPRRHPVPTSALLDPRRLAAIGARARRRLEMGEVASDAAPPLRSDTIAIVAADAEGWRVVVIQSLFHSFGSRVLEPSTGILCHNRGASFSLDPRAPNRLEGGKRPVQTLMPVMVRQGGHVTHLSGTMGGAAQPQIQAEILGRLLDLRLPPGQALHDPRWVVGGLEMGTPPDTVNIESRLAQLVPAFTAHDMPVRMLGPFDEEVGHAQLIVVTDEREFEAASDPRADGCVAVM